MRDLESTCTRYLTQWEARANVLQPERYRVSPDVDPASLTFPILLPTLAHPLVREAGPEAQRLLIMQGVYEYLRAVSDGEGNIVLSVCGLVSGRYGRDLLPPVAQRALQTVSTDEGYHTYVAEEMVADLTAVTGIAHVQMEGWYGNQSMIRDGLDCALYEILPEARLALQLAFVALYENGITEEMIELLRATDRESPFYRFNREHVRDEARHSLFFRAVLAHLWSTMDPEIRRAVDRHLPRVLASYMRALTTNNWDLERLRLQHAGLSPEKAMQVVEDSRFEIADVRANPIWQNMWGCMRVTGMLDDPDLYRALEREGLAANDTRAPLAA
ncbi:MAG: diiron oxygenase [Kiloniellales bacterium]